MDEQQLRDYLTTCWYMGWWRECEAVNAKLRAIDPPPLRIVGITFDGDRTPPKIETMEIWE